MAPGDSLGNGREVEVEVGERHLTHKHASGGHAGSQSEARRGSAQREDGPGSTEHLTPAPRAFLHWRGTKGRSRLREE